MLGLPWREAIIDGKKFATMFLLYEQMYYEDYGKTLLLRSVEKQFIWILFIDLFQYFESIFLISIAQVFHKIDFRLYGEYNGLLYNIGIKVINTQLL